MNGGPFFSHLHCAMVAGFTPSKAAACFDFNNSVSISISVRKTSGRTRFVFEMRVSLTERLPGGTQAGTIGQYHARGSAASVQDRGALANPAV
jgi:hypothetical protein